MYGIAKHQIQDNDNSRKKEKWMGLGVSIPKDLILTHNDLRKSCTWCKIIWHAVVRGVTKRQTWLGNWATSRVTTVGPLGRGAEALETLWKLQKGLADVPGEIRERATDPQLELMVKPKLDGLEKADWEDLLLFSLTKRMMEQCRERSTVKRWRKLVSL